MGRLFIFFQGKKYSWHFGMKLFYALSSNKYFVGGPVANSLNGINKHIDN
jgi:hypothetical protein